MNNNNIISEIQNSKFAFLDPDPILEQRRTLWDYMESHDNGRYYEPPVDFSSLAVALASNSHHESAITYIVNQVMATFEPTEKLTYDTMENLVFNFVVFGNCYGELIMNKLGGLHSIRPLLARYVRVSKNGLILLQNGQEISLPKSHIFHVMRQDINQEIYGLPRYLSALNSALLNEAATLFRRKYYKNGSHAGYILYMTDSSFDDADVEAIEKAVNGAKGPGNFRNMFLYAPNGDKDGIKVIPMSEALAKDEFINIKNTTRDDILAAHRVPPQLLGVVPSNAGGFGNITEAGAAFWRAEILPLIKKMKTINDLTGHKVVNFGKSPFDMASDPS